MCLAIPALVLESDGLTARVTRCGQELEVTLAMMPEAVAPGDYVILLAQRYAVQRLEREDALEALKLFAELGIGDPTDEATERPLA